MDARGGRLGLLPLAGVIIALTSNIQGFSISRKSRNDADIGTPRRAIN